MKFHCLIIQFCIGQSLYRSTKSRFHNASGCAEDNACSGRCAERCVEFGIRKLGEHNTGAVNHSGKFSGGQCDIHIRHAGRRLIVTSCFKFLCGTGHYADNHDLFRVNAHLLGIVSFDNRTEHLLRRFTRGQVIHHIREIVLTEFYPAR